MKGSDSTNSLTKLNGRDECFICLLSENEASEPLVSSKLLRTCGCKFFVHPACWNRWTLDKSDFDCPICRKQSILRIGIPPNPILRIQIPREFEPRSNTVIYIILGFFLILSVAAILSIIFRS